jgi:hypothetical protein
MLGTFDTQNLAELGPTHIGRLRAGTTFDARPGPVALDLAVRAIGTAASSSTIEALEALGAARLMLSLPLARTYGGPSDLVSHVIEPYAAAGALASHTAGAYWSQAEIPLTPMRGELGAVAAGVRTRLGPLDGRTGAELDGALGSVGSSAEGANTGPAVLFRAVGSTRWGALLATGGALLSNVPGFATVTRLRVGSDDTIAVHAKLAGRTTIEPLAARALSLGSELEPEGPWFATPGWTAGGEIGAHPLRDFGVSLGTDIDLTARTWLAERARISYTHTCRCLSVSALGAHRIGRDGVDVWFLVDLVPN